METVVLNLAALTGPANGGVVRAARIYSKATLERCARRGWRVIILCNPAFPEKLSAWLGVGDAWLAQCGMAWPWREEETMAALRELSPRAIVSPLFGSHPFDLDPEQLQHVPMLARMPDALALDHPGYFSQADLAHRRRDYAALARVRLLVTHSQFSKSRLHAHLGLPNAQITVIPHVVFVDDRYEEPPIPSPFVLYPANAWPHKRHELLIEAFARIHARRPELRLVLTGHGVDADLAAVMARFPLARPGIIAAGFVSDAALHGLYRKAEALLFTSAYEGFGMPLIEAFRSGCPILCARHGSLPEIAGEAALWVEPDTAEGWASAFLDRLPGRREELVALGRKRLSLFSHDVEAQFKRVLESFLDAAAGTETLNK